MGTPSTVVAPEGHVSIWELADDMPEVKTASPRSETTERWLYQRQFERRTRRLLSPLED